MSMRSLSLLGCLALSSFASLAFAQAPTDEPEVSASAPVADPVTVEEQEKAEREAKEGKDDDADKDPMGWLGLGFKVGVGRIHSSDIANPTYDSEIAAAAAEVDPAQLEMLGLSGRCSVITERCTTPGRFGPYVAITLSLGGDGFGWDIEPYFQSSPEARAYGVYTGPKLDFHLFSRLYLGFGFGIKGALVSSEEWDYGADLYGRVPLRGTIYLGSNIALVGEFAFGAGATGYASEAITFTHPETGIATRTSPSMTFGVGRTWDASLGLRFP